MAFSSGSRRSESGAQLLARLSTRPDIKRADPFIFGKIASSNQIIELYGSEGVGKTELVLHCAAKVCLPVKRNGISLGGLQAKVIYIDTESKFSILHLAIILEKHIQSVINMHLKSKSEQKEKEISSGIQRNHEMKSVEIQERQDIYPTDAKKLLPQNSEIDISQGRDGVCSGVKDSHTIWRFQKEQQHENFQNVFGDDSQTSSIFQILELTPQEMEEIVQDSLSRIQIIRAFNSQQLLASLLSLETILLEDPQYSLLIVDSISAFYWLDRLASPTSYQHLDSRMTPIAKTLKRYSSDLGLTCLVTKSAYFGEKKSSDQSNAMSHTDSSTYKEKLYNEYLGKFWSSMSIKRIILTSVTRGGNANENAIANETNKRKTKDAIVKVIRAYCLSSETYQHYLFRNDLLVLDNCPRIT